MTIRLNVRNYLVPMTCAEVRVELDLSIAAGDMVRAGYIKEWMSDLEHQFNDCEGHDESE